MTPELELFLERDVEPELFSTIKFTLEKEVGRRSRAPHTRYQWAECYCGRRGCAELFISGHGFETLFKNETGVELSATEIFESEKWSGTYLPMYQNYLANFILNLTNILGTDYFVLGGGLSNSPHIYEGLQEKVDQLHFLQGTPAPRVQKHELGDSAGVIGAALLV